MKKLLVILSLAMMAFSFQAGAATLSLTNGKSGITTTGTNFVSGQEAVKGTKATFQSSWTFMTNKAGQDTVSVTVNPSIFYVTEIILNGVVLAKQGGKMDKVFTLSFLSNTVYDLIIRGSLKTNKDATVDVNVSSVPVPAAVWLFGSALMGLMGVTRRKNALAA